MTMQVRSGTLVEWLVPLAFILCAGWVIWHMPAFTLDFYPPTDPSQFDKLSALFKRNDVTPEMGGLFGGFADIVDWLSSGDLIAPSVETLPLDAVADALVRSKAGRVQGKLVLIP